MNVSLKVKIFDDKGTRVLQVSKSTLTIGSASHCDVVLNDSSVSPEHTRAWLEGGRIWVQDLGSASGTALNDIRLPALKPMLVRDLDVLRLGESQSTLGLEAVVVRAPVVKPKTVDANTNSGASPVDTKAISGAELEKRKDEAQKLARDLADLRLQVQMARLEKKAAEEMGHQLENLKDEVKHVHDQKQKWEVSLQQLEAEKQKMRTEVERELVEFKAKALAELKKAAAAESHDRSRDLEAGARQLKEKHEAELREARAENVAALQRLRETHEVQLTKAREQVAESEKQLNQLREQIDSQRKNFEKELAEFKAKTIKDLQRATNEEAGQQIRPLHEELKKAQTLTKKLEKELAETKARLQSESAERETQRGELEKQLSDVRAKSFRELGAQMLAEAQKLEKWKQEQTAAFEKALHSLARQKSRVWTAQGLDQNSIQEWEADVAHTFRKFILNENDSTPAKRAPQVHQATQSAGAEEEVAPVKEEKRKKSVQKNLKRLRPFAFPALFAVLVGAGLWFVAPFFRQYASRTMSSQVPARSAPAAGQAVPTLPAPYNPKMSKRYRNSYTENVIYLENYIGAEQNAEFRRRWQAELSKIATSEWKLDTWTIAPVAVEEQNLVNDLSKIRASIETTDQEAASIQRMRARESKFLHDLEVIFKGRAGVERFLKLKRAFYQRNQAYLSRAN